jgi:hypothetical protein
MSFVVTTVVLAADVANAGTVTIPYPAGTNQAFFTGANASATGAAVLNDNEVYPEAVSGVRVNYTYGGSDITLTNNTGVTWAAGSTILAQFGRAGADRPGFAPAPAIADVAAAGGSYVQAEVNAAITAINRILRELRAQGVIASS